MTETDLTTDTANDAADDEKDLWPSPGKLLKKLREDLGLSREKVSESLYITVHYVKALENDNFSKLPGHTFIKGYYKSYAEFLGADTEQVINCYLNYLNNLNGQTERENQEAENQNRNKSLIWIAVGVVAVLLIALAIWLSVG